MAEGEPISGIGPSSISRGPGHVDRRIEQPTSQAEVPDIRMQKEQDRQDLEEVETRHRYLQEESTRGSMTLVPEKELDPIVRVEEKIKDKENHKERAAEVLQNVALNYEAGSTLMFESILSNRSLGYSASNKLERTTEQLYSVASGVLSSEAKKRWLDSEEAEPYRARLKRMSEVIEAEKASLEILGPFAEAYHGWGPMVNVLKNWRRTDPEITELSAVFTRGIDDQNVGNLYSIKDVKKEKGYFEKLEAQEREGLVEVEAEKRLRTQIDRAHRWMGAIYVVAARAESNRERAAQLLTPARERLIKDFLSRENYKVKEGEVEVTQSIDNPLAMRQQPKDLERVKKFLRACLAIDAWGRLSGEVRDEDYKDVVGDIVKEMDKMYRPSNEAMRGTIRYSHVIEDKALNLSMAFIRHLGLASLWGAGVSETIKYDIIESSENADREIMVNTFSKEEKRKSKSLYLKRTGDETELYTGDTRAEGGDWDFRWPLMYFANTAKKAWNEGRSHLLREETEKILEIINESHDRDDPRLQKIMPIPNELVVGFMEWATVSLAGEKETLINLFYDGVPLYHLPWDEMRSNELYKWLIQINQAGLLYEILIQMDEASVDKVDALFDKYIEAPQGLQHLVKRVSLATGHDREESIKWTALLVSMMWSHHQKMFIGKSLKHDTASAKSEFRDKVITPLRKLHWRDKGPEEFGEIVAKKVKEFFKEEKERKEQRDRAGLR